MMQKETTMPKYDYRCKSCGKVVEIEHSMYDMRQWKCLCGGDMKVSIVQTPIHYKSRGFYAVDKKYKDKG
jgi:putative FmdB family regulatory protein